MGRGPYGEVQGVVREALPHMEFHGKAGDAIFCEEPPCLPLLLLLARGWSSSSFCCSSSPCCSS